MLLKMGGVDVGCLLVDLCCLTVPAGIQQGAPSFPSRSLSSFQSWLQTLPVLSLKEVDSSSPIPLDPYDPTNQCCSPLNMLKPAYQLPLPEPP